MLMYGVHNVQILRLSSQQVTKFNNSQRWYCILIIIHWILLRLINSKYLQSGGWKVSDAHVPMLCSIQILGRIGAHDVIRTERSVHEPYTSCSNIRVTYNALFGAHVIWIDSLIVREGIIIKITSLKRSYKSNI